jgi:elongation factor P
MTFVLQVTSFRFQEVMLSISDIKTGKSIVFNGEPYVVTYHEHSKTGRAGAVLRTKLKNLKTGAVLDKTFQGSDKVDEADMTTSKAQYLYNEGGENYFFMDSESYDQFSLPKDVIGNAPDFLVEGTDVTILNYNSTPINVQIPIKVKLKVVEAPPGIKGDTVSTGGKMVTLETGLKISTPLFVKEGDTVIVNTEKGEYVSRA